MPQCNNANKSETSTGADTGFSEGWSGVIAPVGEKLLFEHTKFSATRGGGDHPYHHPHPPTPVSATVRSTATKFEMARPIFPRKSFLLVLALCDLQARIQDSEGGFRYPDVHDFSLRMQVIIAND